MPWRDDRDARVFLSHLANVASGAASPAGQGGFESDGDRLAWAAWLVRNDFAGLGFAAARVSDPELAPLLREAAAGEAAGNLAHFETLDRIERRFESEHVPMVLLKGAAVAGSAYRDPSLRPMTDIDIWLKPDDMPRAAAALSALGFRGDPSPRKRPEALQRHSGGELVFHHARREHGRVELHYGAFPGWWIRRAANPDTNAVWHRAEPLGPGRHASRLATEDAILQTAFHVAVNQFGQSPLRGLMDLAVLARAYPVDWDAIVERARVWRLATATWLVLDAAHRWIGLPGSDAAVSRLRPARARGAMLRAFVTPHAVFSGRGLAQTTRRHLFMLALVDRPKDGARLIGRTLWPETWWMSARYGRPMSRVGHLWGIVKRREV